MTVLRVQSEELNRAAPLVYADPESPLAIDMSEVPWSDDAEAAPRLLARDPDYVGVLFERYSRLVLHTAYRVLNDAAEAEEVLQDVFLYLYRRAALYDASRGSLKAWIVQITVCRARDRRAYLARRRSFAADIDLVDVPQRTDLDGQLEARLSRKHLEKALADLSHMQRRTIESFYFEGLDLREISQQLREPLGNVRHHFYRGLKRLRNSTFLHRFRCK